MAKEQKKTLVDFRTFCEGTPCAEMMGKMMDGKEEGQRFSCAEMLTQMMQRCCGAKEKKEASPKETKRSSTTECVILFRKFPCRWPQRLNSLRPRLHSSVSR